MVSVVQRIRQVKQPRGGYVNPKLLTVTELGGAGALAEVDHKVENVHASIMGLSVDYLTRLAGGTEPQEAFHVSLLGAAALGQAVFTRAVRDIEALTPGVIDDATIAAACRLSGYDVGYRAGPAFYNPDAVTTPDATTTEHIRTMVARSLRFFRDHGPVTLDGFTFEGGYTELVNAGDGDFLTADTLWDFKVSVSAPTNAHTLQLLIYYLLGKRSIHPEFQPVTHIGVFNPRLDTMYRLSVGSLPPEVVAEVSREVVGHR